MIDVRITDHAALAARSPSELAMYLRARGWRLRGRTSVSAQWTFGEGAEEFEILQPLEARLRDYSARMLDALRVLAIVEERSELDILSDISNASMDVHQIRAFPAESGPGMIGLDDGVHAFESLRSLVVAAAYSVSVDQPKAVQPARKPADVLRYLRDVRIGPSTEGSFLLSVHTPIPPRLTAGQGSPFDDDSAAFEPAEPFERQVSLRIYDVTRAAYSAANDALVDPNGLDSFTRSIRRGVSANLCEALVGLGGEAGHPFELSLSLAPSRPIAGKSWPPVRFRRDHLPVLAAAAQQLRELAAEESVTVVGNVVRLHREGSGASEIGIAGSVEGDDRLRRIWFELAASDYTEAVRAHREMRQVSVRGDLVRRGTRVYLRNPSVFRVIAEESDRPPLSGLATPGRWCRGRGA